MTPTITAFARSPDRGSGLARDMRVRWALEEVGQDYRVRLVSFAEMKEPDHLARQPFGQIPTYEDGEVTLFESGAIVLHLAERYPGLLSEDAAARGRALSWVLAALNTVEPLVLEREAMGFLETDKPWYGERLAMVDERLRQRLAQLSRSLGNGQWLDFGFSAGDLVMVGVLMRIRTSGLLDPFANLAAYLDRAELRPAYQRAFADQLAVFKGLSLES